MLIFISASFWERLKSRIRFDQHIHPRSAYFNGSHCPFLLKYVFYHVLILMTHIDHSDRYDAEIETLKRGEQAKQNLLQQELESVSMELEHTKMMLAHETEALSEKSKMAQSASDSLKSSKKEADKEIASLSEFYLCSGKKHREGGGLLFKLLHLMNYFFCNHLFGSLLKLSEGIFGGLSYV